MKKLLILTAALAILLMGGPQVAMATSLLNGTIDTINSPSYVDTDSAWGYRYDHLINTGTIFTPGPGTGGVTLWGSVNNLSFGSNNSWLEIGLVAKNRADAAFSSSNPSYMNNQSAFFLVGKWNDDIYIQAGDYSGGLPGGMGTYTSLGQNVTAFDFKFEVLPNGSGAGGTARVTVNNSQTSSISYGYDNWEMEWYYGGYIDFPTKKEFTGDFNNAYVVAQAFAGIGTGWGTPDGSIYADVDVVPLPGTVLLLGSGLVGLVGLGWRRRKTKA